MQLYRCKDVFPFGQSIFNFPTFLVVEKTTVGERKIPQGPKKNKHCARNNQLSVDLVAPPHAIDNFFLDVYGISMCLEQIPVDLRRWLIVLVVSVKSRERSVERITDSLSLSPSLSLSLPLSLSLFLSLSLSLFSQTATCHEPNEKEAHQYSIAINNMADHFQCLGSAQTIYLCG